MSRTGGWAGAALVAAGAALFGTVGTAQALGPSASPVAVGAVRLLVAAAALLALAAPHGGAALRRAWATAPVWAAGLAQAAFNVSFLTAVDRAGVAIGTLIAIGCTPVLTGILTRQLSRGWAASTLLALVGLVLLLGGDLEGGVTLVGVLFALAASASYAVFITASAAISRAPLDTTVAIAAAFTVAAVALTPGLTAPLGWVTTPSGATMVLYLALAATVLAYSSFNRGIRSVTPGTAATLGLVEPLVAAVLGVLVLDERLSGLAWGGALLILGALVIAVRVSRPAVSAEQSTA